MTTGPFGVEIVSKAFFKPKVSIAARLSAVKSPTKLTTRSGGPGGTLINENTASGRKWVGVSDTWTKRNSELNRAGAQARRKVNGS